MQGMNHLSGECFLKEKQRYTFKAHYGLGLECGWTSQKHKKPIFNNVDCKMLIDWILNKSKFLKLILLKEILNKFLLIQKSHKSHNLDFI